MTDDSIREVFISGEPVFNGRVIHVEHWQVRLPNGREALREVCVHPGAAAIVPVFEDGTTVLVRQSRVAVNDITTEIPAGKKDGKGENPLCCAKRELEEETGLNAGKWRLLTCMRSTPGFCDEEISIYLATELTQCAAHTDEDEFLGLVRVPLEEAVARVLSGELNDSKTALGLLLAQRALKEA